MARALAALAGREFDLLVVGGGITGAIAAWDAAQRGLSVALLERADFGGATSAESLKVVHGGVRYLQHLDIVRVRESSRERRALLRMAPHLVHPMPFVVPTYGHAMRGPEILGAAFVILNSLTADRNRGLTDPSRKVPRARIVSRARVLEWFPEIDQEGLTGAGVFYDGQMFNPPRLVWAMIRTAARAGAAVANYCDVTALMLQGGRVMGVQAEDRLGGEKFEVRARTVINAAGPYAEALLVRSGVRAGRSVPFSRDMALVLKRQFVNGRALALQTKYRDPSAVLTRGPRHLFLVPWRGRTLVGVNSLIWRDEPDGLRVTESEVADFVAEIAEADPKMGLTMDDVALVMAGLLPVEKGDEKTGDVAFGKRPLVVDNARTDNVQGLVSAISNRYTVARGVAEKAVDLVYHKLGREVRRSRTEITRIHGGDFFRFDELVREVTDGSARGHRPRHCRSDRARPRLRLRRGPAAGAGAARVRAHHRGIGIPPGRSGSRGPERDGLQALRCGLRPDRHRQHRRSGTGRAGGVRRSRGRAARVGRRPPRERAARGAGAHSVPPSVIGQVP